MTTEIINRVANSSLEIFDLEDFYPKAEIVEIGMKKWLFEGMVLREKDFREELKKEDWEKYLGKMVCIWCEEDVIVPAWSYILIGSYLAGVAERVVVGRKIEAVRDYYKEVLRGMDFSVYKDKSVIIKGCSGKEVPIEAYVEAIVRMKDVVKRISYGEACSSVPITR